MYFVTKEAINVSKNLKWRPMPLKMAVKLIMSNIASAHYQWYARFSVMIDPNDIVPYGVT